MKESYDAKHRAESFEVGEFAFLSPRGLFLSVAGSKKFMARQLGPFEIIERVGRLTYKLLVFCQKGRQTKNDRQTQSSSANYQRIYYGA